MWNTVCAQLPTKGQNLKGVIIDRCGIPKAMRSDQTREELKDTRTPQSLDDFGNTDQKQRDGKYN